MQLENAFCKNAYIDEGRLDHSFVGAILDTLKLTQHMYKREDLAKLYHFIGDLFADGDFSWAGEVSFVPRETKPLTKELKKSKISKEKDEGINRPLSEGDTTLNSGTEEAAASEEPKRRHG